MAQQVVTYNYGKQKPLAEYCQNSDAEDVVLTFLHVFNSASRRLPRMDLANQCSPSSSFLGTSLLHCPETAIGVKLCQSKGKAVLLSLGGAAGAYGFSNDEEAKDFAHMIWNLFLRGSSSTRPLDDAVLDGVDLDIEGGSPLGYPAFIAELRSLYATDTRKAYYISAAPQCPFPDAYLGITLESAWVDMVFVQFYNNYCGTQAYGSFKFNFDQWHEWAKTTSVNKNVKIYLGIPASRTAANAGYVTTEKLAEIANGLRCKYSLFGGVMMWDTSQAYGNFEYEGIPYSVAIARNLKRPRSIVCGEETSEEAPVGDLPVLEPVIPATTSIADSRVPTTSTTTLETLESSTTSTTSTMPTTTPTLDHGGPQSSQIASSPTLAPVLICDGYKFAVCRHGRWMLRSCAPGTYCTPHGCDFVQGPVRTCLELEQETNSHSRAMGQQIRQMVDRMWSTFGASLDSTLASYLGVDPSASHQEPTDAHGKQVSPSDHQHPFIVPGESDKTDNNEDNDLDGDFDPYQLEPYLIDFFRLDTNPGTGIVTTNRGVHGPESFRTQGSLDQQGLWVTVKSDPRKEAEQSMVIHFVIEGVRTGPIVHGIDDGWQELWEIASLPDSSTAVFMTEPVSPSIK
ncbi:MAG: glycoside hydrolase superfamily [Benniella sp.]|nr:MAG: glycoside hydrolase superfamily [Benniella sp.]